MATKQTKLKYS